MVVVERTFSIQNGDDNNLISECEWDRDECPTEPELPTEPEEIPLTGTINVIGQGKVGTSLIMEFDNLNGTPGKYHYMWRRSADNITFDYIPGAISDAYNVVQEDEGKYIIGTITNEDRTGSLTSNVIGPITPAVSNPVLSGIVEIDGNIQVGEIVSADIDLLEGVGNPKYHWGRLDSHSTDPTDIANNIELIDGAVNSTYQLDAQDEDKFITVMVSRDGYDGIIFADPVGPVIM